MDNKTFSKRFLICCLVCFALADRMVGQRPDGNDALPYDRDQPIELTIDGVQTLVYADRKQPRATFWYAPSQLYLERRKTSTGRSRVSCVFELYREGKADFVALQLVVRPGYSPAFEQRLKTALSETGHTLVDPIQPEESHRLITLRPIPSRVANIAFDDLFPTAFWLNRDTFRRAHIALDKPFPIYLRLSHYDATVLFESLVQRRLQRVARVEHEHGYTPLYLSLDPDPMDQPLDYSVAPAAGGGWEVILTNPTEYDLAVQHLTYFSERAGTWVTRTVNDTLSAFTDDRNAPDRCRLHLDEQPGALRTIGWRALPDYETILGLYVRNRLPPAPLRITCWYDGRTDGIAGPATTFDSAAVQLRVRDQLGLRHTRFASLSLQPGTRLETVIPSFLGVRTLEYALVARRRADGRHFVTPWRSASVEADDAATLALDAAARMWIDQAAGAASIGESALVTDAGALLPTNLAVAVTEANEPKVELRYTAGRLKGYIELWAPLYPQAIEAARARVGEKVQLAQARQARVALWVGDRRVPNTEAIMADAGGHLEVRFSAEGAEADRLFAVLNDGSVTPHIEAWWTWKTPNGLIETWYRLAIPMH